MLTTYGTVLSEAGRQDNPLALLHWHRIVLDEAHLIKNRLSRTTKAIFSLKGRRKWCLTGTPVQNSLSDMYPYLHFIALEPWQHWTWWSRLAESGAPEAVSVERLQKITKCILLRRTLQTIDPETNQPILTLPLRRTFNIWLTFVREPDGLHARNFMRRWTMSGIRTKQRTNVQSLS